MLMMKLIALLGCVVLCAAGPAPTPEVHYIVPSTDDGFPLKFVKNGGELKSGSALGQYRLTRSMMTEGWNYLEIQMFPDVDPEKAHYAAGVTEGFVTGQEIYDSWRNVQEGFCSWQKKGFCDKLRAFLKTNNDWMRQMDVNNSNSDPFWYQVRLVVLQLDGMIEGFNKYKKQNNITGPTDEDILWMNIMGDLEDLTSALNTDFIPQELRGDGRCSALIKLLPGNLDLYTSQVTWNSLQSMLRFQKKYIFPFYMSPDNKTVIPGHTSTFSSYPGVIASNDDFYLLSSGLVSQETTIGNSNPALWSKVKPEGELQEWIRVLVANRLATDGKSWTEIFKQYNSGTYNNQWMIVDYNKFTPGKPLVPGTLWVSEQIPGLVVSDDLTHLLQQQTYFPSYNLPYFPKIYNDSGIPALVKQYGDWFTYDKNPRANIFRRDHVKVKDMGSMIKLMRYNNYTSDPLSACDCSPPYSAENAISCRDDLNPENGTYPFGSLGHRSHVGTDMKVTSSDLFKKKHFLAQAGPTYDDMPVFVWSKSSYNKLNHYGHPDTFKFKVVEHDWQLSWPSTKNARL